MSIVPYAAQVQGLRGGVGQLQPVPADVVRGKAFEEQPAECALLERAVVEHKASAWECVQDARPRGDDAGVQPLQPAEIAEGGKATGGGG